jgi:hypothetical protein
MMNLRKQVFLGRRKRAESPSPQDAHEFNNEPDRYSERLRDLDSLAEPETLAILLQRIQELEETQKRQAAQIRHYAEYIHALDRRIQELECLPVQQFVKPKFVEQEIFDNSQDEDKTPTAPSLPSLPRRRQTKPLPAPSIEPSDMPTIPLPVVPSWPSKLTVKREEKTGTLARLVSFISTKLLSQEAHLNRSRSVLTVLMVLSGLSMLLAMVFSVAFSIYWHGPSLHGKNWKDVISTFFLTCSNTPFFVISLLLFVIGLFWLGMETGD